MPRWIVGCGCTPISRITGRASCGFSPALPSGAQCRSALAEWDAETFENAAAEAASWSRWRARSRNGMRTPQGRAVPTLPLIALERIGDAPAQPPAARCAPARRTARARTHSRARRAHLRPVARHPWRRRHAGHCARTCRRSRPEMPIPAGASFRRMSISTPAKEWTLCKGCWRTPTSSYSPTGRVHWHAAGSVLMPQRGCVPGIVYVSLSAYGHAGPWADRRGFDSLVQTASGLNLAEAEAAGEHSPRALPCQAIDHAAGYLAALGAHRCSVAPGRNGRQLAGAGFPGADRLVAAWPWPDSRRL